MDKQRCESLLIFLYAFFSNYEENDENREDSQISIKHNSNYRNIDRQNKDLFFLISDSFFISKAHYNKKMTK